MSNTFEDGSTQEEWLADHDARVTYIVAAHAGSPR